MTSESKHKIIFYSVQSVAIAGLLIWAPFHGHMPQRYKVVFYVLVAIGLVLAVDELLRRKQKLATQNKQSGVETGIQQ
jgi:predicted membrane channel-forming protein YqfA (hemolysin III family)